MSDWTDGYVSEIDYTYGYYYELSPQRAELPLLNAGIAPPSITTACELGFGQGYSINLHAAASGVRWWGTDFNPAQALFARSLSAASGAGAQLVDQSFAEFCARTDLPDFDYIGLHGVWSWISEDNERIIVDFLRRKLSVGGILYVSYNTQPGSAAMVPLRRLLMQHIEVMAPPGRGIVSQIDAAVEFAEKLLALPTAFSTANPTIAQRITAMKGLSRNYLAHEYFNRDWRAVQFGEMAQRLAPAKLSYAGSANYLDLIDAINLTPDQQRFLGELPDPSFRQSVRDFMVNQLFRRDYWIKGARRLAPLEHAAAIRGVRVVLGRARTDITTAVVGALGRRDMQSNIYVPILDAVGDQESKTLGEIETALRHSTEMPLGTLFEAVMVLLGKGDLMLVQDEAVQAKARPQTDRLNRHLLERARGSGDLLFLASPVTGAGIAATRFHQLFLLAMQERRKTAEELAVYAWETIGPQGQRVLKDGKALDTAEENLTELTAQASEFLDKRLTVLQKLKVA